MADEPQTQPDAAAPKPADAPAPEADSTERTFAPITTQWEFDRAMGYRLREVKDKYADYEELKTKAAELDELQESSKTELEKAVARAEAAEKAREETLTEAKETRLRAAIIAEAAKADRKVVDPDAVVALLDRSTLELDDSGTPTNIAKALDSLLEAKPFLVAQGGTRPGADQGARPGAKNQVTEAELQSMTAEQIVEARKAGRLTSLGVGA